MITRLLLLLASCAGTGLSIRPRGVRPELASLYNPAADFACLDGSATIPFIQVNDDYCDCDVSPTLILLYISLSAHISEESSFVSILCCRMRVSDRKTNSR